jgi:enoyl-CoA hydratase
MTDELLVDHRDNGIAVLTLNAPSRRNAMSDAMTAAWRDAIAELRTEADLRCVVVTGAGTAFSSGGDLASIAERTEIGIAALRDHLLDFYRSWLSIRTLEVPTIAAINGAAVGAGLCLALACDLRYAATDARLIAPFTRLGIHPGMAATYLLPEVAGVPLAREMLFTGRAITGSQAETHGMINQAVPGEEVIEVAMSAATDIAGNGPVATRLTKAALVGGGHRNIEEALRWESLAQPVTMASGDLLEGIAAHREKRPPVFGRS